jgi:hypothetical protein
MQDLISKIKEELKNQEATAANTDSDPDSYNMGYIEGSAQTLSQLVKFIEKNEKGQL